MNTHSLIQGTAEWAAHRAEHFNASDAPAMMGCSPYKTRSDLLRESATGVSPEVSADLQHIFNEGHRVEAAARPFAEDVLGAELYPVVGTDGVLSASFDGITMGGDVVWECKSLNNDLRAVMPDGLMGDGRDLPLHYRVQVEQQLAISKAARVLFTAASLNADGSIRDIRHAWYEPDLALRADIVAGWDQFATDLAAWEAPTPEAPKPQASTIESLPAVFVRVEGRVIDSNVDIYRSAALAFVDRIKTDLSTDQDFADAEATVKFCTDAEAKLKLTKEQALAQTASLDQVFRALDEIGDAMRAKRLALEKLVTRRKDELRGEIAAEAQADLRTHIEQANTTLPKPWLTVPTAAWGDAMKGKRSVQTTREAVHVMLAGLKVEATKKAKMLAENWALIPADAQPLFPDFVTVASRTAEDFGMLVQHRINEAAAAKAKAEAEAAAQQAQAKPPGTLSQVMASVDPVALDQALKSYAEPEASPSTATLAAATDDGEPMTTGKVCEFFGVGTMTADLLRELGATPSPAPKGKAGTYWPRSSLHIIGTALIQRIQQRLGGDRAGLREAA